jgi:hypothetical protein
MLCTIKKLLVPITSSFKYVVIKSLILRCDKQMALMQRVRNEQFWWLRFHVLKVTNMKISVFCEDKPCSQVQTGRRFYQKTLCNIPQGSHPQTLAPLHIPSHCRCRSFYLFPFILVYYKLTALALAIGHSATLRSQLRIDIMAMSVTLDNSIRHNPPTDISHPRT